MDPASLIFTVAPLLVRAATIIKLCQDVLSKVRSAPTTLASIITQCNSMNHVLLEVQNLGLKDMSCIDEARRTRFKDEIDEISVACGSTLASIEKHVEHFQSDPVIVGPMKKFGSRDKAKIAWVEDEVQKLLDELRVYQQALTTELSLLQVNMGMSMQQQLQMHGTVLTKLLERSAGGTWHRTNRRDDDSSRFSIASSSNSSISDTSFDVDLDTINTEVYRRAWRKQLKTIISLPLPPSDMADDMSSRAVMSLAETDSHYNFSASLVPEPESLEAVISEYVQHINFGDDPLSENLGLLSNATEDNSRNSEVVVYQSTEPAPLIRGRRDPNLPRTISSSSNVEHISHLDFDPKTGKIVGLPPDWLRALEEGTSFSKIPEIKIREPSIMELPGPLEFKHNPQHSMHGGLRSEIKVPQGNVPRKPFIARKKIRPQYIKSGGEIKIVVVGDNSSVKSKMLITYTTNKYPSEYVPTVFDNYAVKVMIGEEAFTLALFDTSGQEDYDRLRPLSYPKTNIFLILASIGSEAEFENARDKWAAELEHHCHGIPVLLIGVKDPGSEDDDFSGKDVQLGEWQGLGMKMATEIGAAGYFECDLLSQEGLKNVFDEALITVLDGVPGPPKAKKKSRWRRMAAKNMGLIEEEG